MVEEHKTRTRQKGQGRATQVKLSDHSDHDVVEEAARGNLHVRYTAAVHRHQRRDLRADRGATRARTGPWR
jgi:hypothetical protein